MILFLVYSLTGRICIFFLQKFPFAKLLWIGPLWQPGGMLYDLWSCDLCLGTWVFTFLSAFFGLNLLGEYFYMPFLSELLTGAATSLLVHLLRLGFEAKFSVIRIE